MFHRHPAPGTVGGGVHRTRQGKPLGSKRVEIDETDPARLAGRLKLDDGVGFLARVLSARADSVFEALTRQTQTTPRQFAVLLTLHQRGSMTLTELAQAIRVDRSTLGEMTARMTRRGLIERRSHPEDGRAAALGLSPDGTERLLELVAPATALQSELLAAIEPHERAQFIELLKRLALS
jgi:DNA-binding MarR family transcriptional regulator